ncbi:MAG: hypothetical protein QM639_06595 [Rhodocyclaceae bacterium]
MYGQGNNTIHTFTAGTATTNPGILIEDLTPPAELTFQKRLNPPGRSSTSDQFTVEIQNAAGMVLNHAVQSTTAGTGAAVNANTGTTGITQVPANKPLTLFERMAPGSASTLGSYTATLSCTGYRKNGTWLPGLPANEPYNMATGYVLPPLPSESRVTCTLANTQVGLLVQGWTFTDDGAGGAGPAVPNNGLQDGLEGALGSGVTIRVTNCAATPTVFGTVSPQANGNYGRYVFPPANTLMCVEATSPGRISTGASSGGAAAGVAPLPAGYTYSRNGTTGRIQFLWQGGSLPAMNFGFVPVNSLLAHGSQQAGANSTVMYAHQFSAGTGGSVTYAATGAASSGSAAWSNTTTVYDDANCNGALDTGEGQLFSPLAPAAAKTVTSGTTCIVVSQVVPANAADGDVHTATIEATFDYPNANPPLASTQHTVTEVTTVALAGLSKAFSAPSIFAGQSGDLVLTLTNSSPGLSQNGLGFTDTLPAGLVLAPGNPLVSNTCGGTVTAIAGAGAVTLTGGAMTAATANCAVTVRVTSSSPPVIGECSPSHTVALTNKASNVTTVDLRNDVVDACLAVRPSGISGRIFADNGVGAGVGNNGIRDGSEGPIAGVQVRLTDCAATVYNSSFSDGTGSYALDATAVPLNATVCVEQINLASHVSTGASLAGAALPAGYTYVRPATPGGSPDHVSFQWQGSAVAALDFGDVADNTFAASGQQDGVPNSTVSYAHTFTTATTGKVSFSVTNSRPDWATTVFADPLCTGTLQAGAAQLFPPLGVGSSVMVGDKVCIVVRQFIPATVALGDSHAIGVDAVFDYLNAHPALPVATYTLNNVTKVALTALSLKKEVRNVTVSGPFGMSNQAKPGDELEYRIVYTNNAPGVITNLAINDTTPAYTTFVSSTAGTTPTALGACSKNTPANPPPAPAVDCTAGPAQPVGGTGALHWLFGGGLEAGATGEVLFRVKVD